MPDEDIYKYIYYFLFIYIITKSLRPRKAKTSYDMHATIDKTKENPWQGIMHQAKYRDLDN